MGPQDETSALVKVGTGCLSPHQVRAGKARRRPLQATESPAGPERCCALAWPPALQLGEAAVCRWPGSRRLPQPRLRPGGRWTRRQGPVVLPEPGRRASPGGAQSGLGFVSQWRRHGPGAGAEPEPVPELGRRSPRCRPRTGSGCSADVCTLKAAGRAPPSKTLTGTTPRLCGGAETRFTSVSVLVSRVL